MIWKGLKITGKAYRVPARTGSIAELNLLTERHVTVDPRLVLGATVVAFDFSRVSDLTPVSSDSCPM